MDIWYNIFRLLLFIRKSQKEGSSESANGFLSSFSSKEAEQMTSNGSS